MANKYIIHGATYCGDGTTSAEAASAGAAGAWNTITIFTGTTPPYGALGSGDTVFIRSKDAAGADITQTMAAAITIGSAAGSALSWVTWVLDNGTVWPGVNGTLTYTHASTYSVTLRAYNRYVCKSKDHLVFSVTGKGSASAWVVTPSAGGCACNGLLFDASGQTGAGSAGASTGASHALFENCTFKYNIVSANGWYLNTPGVYLEFVNPIFLINYNSTRLFYVNDTVNVLITGGKIHGAGSLVGMHVFNSAVGPYSFLFKMLGTEYPPEVSLMPLIPGGMNIGAEYAATWGDRSFGSEVNTYAGVINSRNDGNFPTLNSVYPDGSSWSWKCYAHAASVANPLALGISKLYVDASAIKTITLNVLFENSYVSGMTDAIVWIVGSYIDAATDLPVGFSSIGTGGAIDASSALWSADFYGAVNCSDGKKAFVVTTGTQVKQGTQINLRLFVAKPAVSSSNIFFVCPDIVLT